MNRIMVIFLIISSFLASGQEAKKSELIPGVIKKDLENVKTFSTLYSDNENVCYSYSRVELNKKDIVIIAGTVFCSSDNKLFYKALHKGNNVLIDSSDVATDVHFIDKFDNMDTTQFRNYIEEALKVDNAIMTLDTLNAKKEFLQICKQGLVIVSDNVYDESEYTSGTGFKVEILNASAKTIKYITFNYVGYNSVDDPVQQFGKSLLTLKGIGPIKSFETAKYEKEYAWLTDIVQYEYIKSITIQYMDGTTKVLKNIKAITLSNRGKKYLEMDN